MVSIQIAPPQHLFRQNLEKNKGDIYTEFFLLRISLVKNFLELRAGKIRGVSVVMHSDFVYFSKSYQ